MNKKLLALLLPVFRLTSCSNPIDIIVQYGNGKIEDDRIGVSYRIHDQRKDGYEIKGFSFAAKNAKLSDKTYFSLVNVSPLYSESYKEHLLIAFRKQDYIKKDDGMYRIDFAIKLEKLSDYFEKTDENKKAAFFIHGDNFNRDDITTYNTSDFEYTFDGTTLKITK